MIKLPRLDRGWTGGVSGISDVVGGGTDDGNRCDGTCPDIWTIGRMENVRRALDSFIIFIGKGN